jgi:DNA-repair protein XRCC1
VLENPFKPMIPLGLSSLTIVGSSGEENEMKGSTLDVPLLDNDEMDRSLDEDSKENELEVNRKERRGEIKAPSSASASVPLKASSVVDEEPPSDKKKSKKPKFVPLDLDDDDNNDEPVKKNKKKAKSESQETNNDEKKTEKKSEKKKEKKSEKKEKSVPFDEIMKGVVFVISGIQNPDRAELREMAIKVCCMLNVTYIILDGCQV